MGEGIFEKVTKLAIRDILSKYTCESKYGLILSKEDSEDLVADIFQLILNSRQLKSSGDKFLSGIGQTQQTRTSTKELG